MIIKIEPGEHWINGKFTSDHKIASYFVSYLGYK